MNKNITNVFVFLQNFRQNVLDNMDHQFWVYTKYNEFGSLLIKNMATEKRYLLKPWDTDTTIGKNKIQTFLESCQFFKGYEVNNYILIGKTFRDNAKQYATVEKRITVIEVDFKMKKLALFGSTNIEPILFNVIVEFADLINFEISYDFEGMLRHKGFQKGIQQVEKVQRRPSDPKVFISYSWDNENHKLWVLKLAADLIKSGIMVLIDEWDLDKYRNDLHYFMESGIREADYILFVCTPAYAQKADARVGGVGVENTIITGEFYDESKSSKYIPIARIYNSRITECLPTYLKTKYVVDFSDDKKYNQKFEELVRKILGIPRFKRPELGKLPRYKSEDL